VQLQSAGATTTGVVARILALIHTATPDTTKLPRLPVDRHRDAGQAATLYAAQNVNTLWTAAYD